MSNYILTGKTILRDDVPVANYDSDTGSLDFLPDLAKYRAPVVRFLREKGLPVVVTATPAPAASVTEGDAPTDEQVAQAQAILARANAARDKDVAPITATTGLPGLIPLIEAGKPLPRTVDAPVSKIKSKGYAGAPPMDPDMGDKTPAFVDWLYENHPEDAARRYYGRKTHRDDDNGVHEGNV